MDLIVKLVWLALLLIFIVGEAVSVGLTSIWFAAGSLVALISALLGANLWVQIALFIIVSLLCLLAVRPLAKKYLNPRIQATNADRIIGTKAKVSEDIDNVQGRGVVSISGVAWTARSEDGSPIPAGALVRVLRIEGVKVYVEKVKEEVKC